MAKENKSKNAERRSSLDKLKQQVVTVIIEIILIILI